MIFSTLTDADRLSVLVQLGNGNQANTEHWISCMTTGD